MNVTGTLTMRDAAGTDLRFDARYASGFVTAFDSGESRTAPNPVETLLGALAACEAMDVIAILRKKRLDVTAYDVVMSGERADTPPRRYTSITLVHRVTGRGVPRAAVEDAVRLSASKYCSVHFSLDPAMPVENRVEILEA